MNATRALLVLAFLAFLIQSTTALAQTLTRSPLAGGEGNSDFELAIPDETRLASIEVNVGPWRNGSEVIKGLKFVTEHSSGQRAELKAGPCDGQWQKPVELAEGVQLVGVSGRHGLVMDSLCFHFSDGKTSPRFGGNGGGDEFQFVLREERGKHRGTVRGLFGKHTNDSLSSIGLIMGEADGRPAELAGSAGVEALTLTIEGQIDEELSPVAGRMAAEFYRSYPLLLKRFDNPDKPAPRHITLAFEPRLRVPAYCSGAKVTVSADWLRRNPNDIGMLTHELTHAVQAYSGRRNPGWLVEGVADYARHLYGPEVQPGWALPRRLSERHSYEDSYGVTARFLVWLDEKHPGSVDQLHRKMQNREFAIEDFENIAGKPVQELWDQCVSELQAGS